MILTKRPGADDDVSDADAEDISSLYKNPDGMSRYQKQGDGCFNSLFSNSLENSAIGQLKMFFFKQKTKVCLRPILIWGIAKGTGNRSIIQVCIFLSITSMRNTLTCFFPAGSPAERLQAMNAARSVERSQPMFDARPANEDVFFDLVEQEKVAWGQPFNVQIQIQVFFN